METIKIFVNGKPRTAGSKSAFVNKKTKKIIVAPAGKHQVAWMDTVRWAFIRAGYNGKMLVEGPIHLVLNFTFLRPKSHYKKSGGLTKSARAYPTGKPDLSKLNRAVEDALTGLIWRDDSQVVQLNSEKRYGLPEGCKIYIKEIHK